MGDYLNEVFGPTGLLAGHFTGYVPRPGQIEMAHAVDTAMREGAHLIAEAPTGTGKSLAYAVPAIHHAVRNGKRVVIATANIALQEQLCEKDLPLLAELLPWRFSFALLKGKRNYLCPSRLHEEEVQPDLAVLDGPADADMYRAIARWARCTKTGDVSELPFQPSAALWHRFSTTSDDCKGNDCKFAEQCFAMKAKEHARSVDVIVTNYHLLLLHLNLRELTGRDLVLPPFDVVVCDEGHKLADIAREFFGFRVTQGSVRWAGRYLTGLGQRRLARKLAEHAQAFFDALAGYADSDAYRRRLREAHPVPWSPLRDCLLDVVHAYATAMDGELDNDTRAGIERASLRAVTLVEQLESAMTLADAGRVYTIEQTCQESVALASKVIDVSTHLRECLIEKADSVIVTSATLTTDDGFSYVRSELGLHDARELVVDSPFDFEEQALLIVPEGMPAPKEPTYPDAVADMVARVVAQAEGRTLALFTSYRNLDAAYERLRGSGYRVLRHGDAPRTKLVEEFRADVRSVLLGTESFWAGVDVPGEALSCVIIDRLPFPTPDDPVLDALSERVSSWFYEYSLPRAIIAFKQGFGRLIRARSDRGVVVVLDERIATKGYGRQFLKSLPYTLKSRRLEHVRHFLTEAA